MIVNPTGNRCLPAQTASWVDIREADARARAGMAARLARSIRPPQDRARGIPDAKLEACVQRIRSTADDGCFRPNLARLSTNCHAFTPPTAITRIVCLHLAAWWSTPAAEPASPKTRKVDFNRDVRPILAKNCFACHGQDEAKRAKGLRLDRREAAVKPLKSGETAIVPGDPESSELILRVTEEDETLRMPPRKTGNRLTPAEVDVLKRWIAEGAEYAPHWALIAPKSPSASRCHGRRPGRATASTSGFWPASRPRG